MTLTKGQAARNIVELMDATAFNLVRNRDLLSQAERFQVAETLRDAADALDMGKILKTPAQPTAPLHAWLRRHLIPSDKHDHDGRRLFKLIP